MQFIIKLFPEITIKSSPVRKRFTKQLRDNLRELLRVVDERIVITRDWEKIDVIAPDDTPELEAQIKQVLSNTPGIAFFNKVICHPFIDIDDAFQKTRELWGHQLAGKTFCVRAKRQGNHDFNSIELERYIGGGLNQHCETAGVKLKNPDITVMVEVKDDILYVVEEKVPGLGGFPIGTQDPVLSLMSGGFDSTVSSYMMIKRGMNTHYLFFNLGGKAHEVGVKEVAFYLWNKFGASHRVKFVTVPFEDVVGEILQKIDNSQMGVVLKRMMLRAGSKIAAQMKIKALVTGEAIGQVSSQTLTNLTIIDSVIDTLTLRPLIVMDKGDIIDTARRIGTEQFAANIPEYCGVISKKPTTMAREEKVAATEANFDFAVLDKAIEERRVTSIEKVMNDLEKPAELTITAEAADDAVIIDIRHPDEEEVKPLKLDAEVLKIPFFTLANEVPNLDKSQNYLLYCDKGVMSQLHASHLSDDGYTNFGVYRPAKH